MAESNVIHSHGVFEFELSDRLLIKDGEQSVLKDTDLLKLIAEYEVGGGEALNPNVNVIHFYVL